MADNVLELLPVGGQIIYTFDFSAHVPSASPEITVSSIDYTLPSQLESFLDEDSLSEAKGMLGLKAKATGEHGMALQVAATASLSNGEKVVQYMTVRLSGS